MNVTRGKLELRIISTCVLLGLCAALTAYGILALLLDHMNGLAEAMAEELGSMFHFLRRAGPLTEVACAVDPDGVPSEGRVEP